MTYTKTKPSAPGWYWVRREDYTYRNIHLISRGESGGLFLVHQSPVTKLVPLEEVDHLEFAGPIPEPGAHFIDRLKAAGVELTPDQEAALRVEWPADAAVSVSTHSGQWMIHGVKRKQ
jgi:hypothetical protein